MPKAIFYVFISLLLVVSCECKDMHWRKLPEEKDIAFKGEVKTPPKSVYRKGESRKIQLHLDSSDEEAQDAQFKILSATLADGSPADLDYTSLKIGYNTLSYTPKGPGTHEITLRVAVEGEGNVQDIHCPIEAPLANWKVEGRANSEGNITLTIEGAPEEWRSESWRITNTTFSEGLEGRIEPTPTELNYGTNNLRINLDQAVLTEPHVRLEIQGPDAETRTCHIDLTDLCTETIQNQLREEETREIQDLMDRANTFPISDLNETRLDELSILVEELKSVERKYARILRSAATVLRGIRREATDVGLEEMYNTLNRKYQILQRKTQEYSRKLGRESREVQERLKQQLKQSIQRTDFRNIENILNECILSRKQLGEIMLDLTKYGLGNGDSFTSKLPHGLTGNEKLEMMNARAQLKRDLGEVMWGTRDFYGRDEFDEDDVNILLLPGERREAWPWTLHNKKATKTYPISGNFKQEKTRERKEVYRILIEKGADLDVRDEDGETPLTYAIQDEEDVEIVRMLLETGSTLGDPTQSEKTALTAAVERKQGNKSELIEAVLNQYETNQRQHVGPSINEAFQNVNPNHRENGIARNIYNMLGNVQSYIQSHNQGRLLYYLIRCSHASDDPMDLSRSLIVLIRNGIDINATFDTGWGVLTPLHTIMDDWNRTSAQMQSWFTGLSSGKNAFHHVWYQVWLELTHGDPPPTNDSLSEEELIKRRQYSKLLNRRIILQRRTLQKSLRAIGTILSSGAEPNIPFVYGGENPMYYATGNERRDEYWEWENRIPWEIRNSTQIETQNYLWPSEEAIPEYKPDIQLFKNLIEQYVQRRSP